MLILFALIFSVYSCTDGQYWDPETSTCKNCKDSLPGCATCYSQYKCSKCDEKNGDDKELFLSTNYKCEVRETDENCENWEGLNCVECKNGFYLLGGKCENTCSVEGCIKCNMNKCFKCKDNLVLYEDESDGQKCIDCSSSDNDEECGRCPLGKYFDETTFKCKECKANCARCTTGGNCYLCKGDFALEDPSDPTSECAPIAECTPGHYYGNHCELCNEGFFVKNGKCAKCPNFCARCVDENTCVECKQGATLQGNECKSIEHCSRSSDLIGCLECEDKYYLKDAKCEECDSSCSTCNEPGKCFTCAPNYYFTNKEEGKCESMDTKTCSVADQYGCLHCKSELNLTQLATSQDPDEKAEFNTIKDQLKQKVIDILGKNEEQAGDYPYEQQAIGYYIAYEFNTDMNIPIYEQTCSMCNVECRICEHKPNWCTACNDGFQMTEDLDGTAEYLLQFGDVKVLEEYIANNNLNEVLKENDITEYNLEDKTDLVKVISVIKGNTNSNETLPITIIYNCLNQTERCSSTTMGYCTLCNAPYFLSDMDCINCDESCQQCTDEKSCQTCNNTDDPLTGDKIYWRPNGNGLNGLCIKVEETKEAYKLNCKGPISSSGCNQCEDGYYKNINWGGCKQCPKECKKCELSEGEFETDLKDFQTGTQLEKVDSVEGVLFKCTSCLSHEDDGVGQILKDGRCIACSTIPNCIQCNGANERCEKCSGAYEVDSGTGKCVISDLVIAVPIVSVAIVIFIIIIIVVVILIWRKRVKTMKEREKEIKPFKVSSEVEMALLSADNESFPLKTSTWKLDFGHAGSKLKIDTEYEQIVQIMNPTKKSYFFEILAGASHRYELTAEPMRQTLKPGFAIEVKFTIKMLCTSIVQDEIGIVAMDMDEDSKETAKLTIVVESDLSLKLDHSELQLKMPAIGEGAFGMVFRGTYRGQNVAVKKMKARNLTQEQEKEFKHEVNMLTQYRHACIVNLVGAVYTEGEISIVTEFADHGSLSKVWSKEKTTYDWKIKVMEDAVVALSYLHENSIIHRDVKGENVLVYSLNPHSPVCGKLTDFGTCRNISERALQTKEITNGIGTPTYMAPECLANNKYSYSADVYSFGIVLYETYIERNGYEDDPQKRFNQPWMIPQFVIEGKRLDKPEGIPENYWQLTQQCWAHEADERPTFPQIYATLATFPVDITHTDMSNKVEAISLPTGDDNQDDAGEGDYEEGEGEYEEEQQEEESSSSSSSSDD